MADQDKKRLVVTVTGYPDQLSAFVKLCKTFDYLGAAGCSRTVQIPYDGDGRARLRFDFGSTDVSGVEAVKDTDSDIVRVPGID